MQADAATNPLWGRRRDHLAHQHGPIHLGWQREAFLGEHVGQPGQLGGVSPRGQVVQRDQGVGLAPTEVGLQLDHRVAALARQAPGRAGQQIAQSLGYVGAGVERVRVLVLGLSAARCDQRQVGRVFGLLEAPGGHVGVGRDDVAPRGEPGLGGSLGGLGCGAAAL